MEITKEIQLDYGHIVHMHTSACKNPHGHRARIIAHLKGDLINDEVSENGMVMDFKHIKQIMMNRIHSVLDHSFIIWNGAKQVPFLEEMNENCYNGTMRLVLLNNAPTAENLAKWCFDQMLQDIKDIYGTGLRLCAVEFWETPSSCAVYTPDIIPLTDTDVKLK